MKLSEPQKRFLHCLYSAHPWSRACLVMCARARACRSVTIYTIERKGLVVRLGAWWKLTDQGLALARRLENQK